MPAGTPYRWTEERERSLIHMREVEGLTWPMISMRLHVCADSCSAKYRQLRPEAAPKRGVNGRKRWREQEIQTLVYMRETQKKDWPEIAKALDRTAGACSVFYSNHKTGQRWRRDIDRKNRAARLQLEPLTLAKAPPDLLEEREARNAAAHNRTLTASVFGDPPPGFSALDKKRQEAGA